MCLPGFFFLVWSGSPVTDVVVPSFTQQLYLMQITIPHLTLRYLNSTQFTFHSITLI